MKTRAQQNNKSRLHEKYNINIVGSGTMPMLFAHGLGLDQNTWRMVTPEFTEQYKVILFDYVGCGKSDKNSAGSARYCSLEGYAEDVNDICETLEMENVIFIGHSISSMIGLLAALKRPNYYKQFVFISPSPRFLDDTDGYIGGYSKNDVDQIIKHIEEDYAGWVNTIVPSIANNSNSPKLVDEIIHSFMSNDKDLLKQFALTTFFSDHRKELLKFDKPCVILQSADDIVVPLQVGDYLHAHLSDSKLVRLKGKGHFPQITSPAEIVKEIQRFISSK